MNRIFTNVTKGLLKHKQHQAFTHKILLRQNTNSSFSFLSKTTSIHPNNSNTSHQIHKPAKIIKRAYYDSPNDPKNIRNVAVVAHVDHGKTSIVNQILSHVASQTTSDTKKDDSENKSMDSNEIEKERGITIISKVTRLPYVKDNGIINIVDTPGHVDFSGEVDRIVHLINGICLVVDINEGVLSQTKYVLQKALKSDENLRVVLVLNKCDNATGFESRVISGAVETQVLDLFDTLGANDEQMDYSTIYASARSGWFTDDIDVATKLSMNESADGVDTSVQVLLNSVWNNLPSPPVTVPTGEDDKFSFIVNNIGSDTYLGKLCTGKIHSGSIRINDNVSLVASSDDDKSNKDKQGSSLISGMFVHQGSDRVPLSSNVAFAGDIVTVAGIPASSRVGDTITHTANPVTEPIHSYPIPQPILSVEVGPNSSPFLGQEDSLHVTSTKIYNRLHFEMENNISLNLQSGAGDSEKCILFGRGTLQLGILFEQMRRDKYEFTISPPTILLEESAQGKAKKEPYEEVIIDIPFDYQGAVMNLLTSNRGIFMDMENYNENTSCKLYFELPTQSLMGMHMELASMTKGCAVLNHSFLEYRPIDSNSNITNRVKRGKLVSNATGKANLYALSSLMNRGVLFVTPGEKVYAGMVIGERTDIQKDVDLEVNPIKAKQLSNMRVSGKEEAMYVPPSKKMTMEELISYMDYDEVVEITPQNIRLRKKELDASVRARLAKDDKKRKLSAKKK